MLRKDVRGEFIEALMSPREQLLVERIATRMSSTSNKENYAWLSEVYEMEEFVDSMPIQPLSDGGLTPETGADDQCRLTQLTILLFVSGLAQPRRMPKKV